MVTTGSDGGSRPEWLYGQGCCEHWTPLEGCSDGHTGRPAMSLPARALDEEPAVSREAEL
jgi:hypothetical protein